MIETAAFTWTPVADKPGRYTVTNPFGDAWDVKLTQIGSVDRQDGTDEYVLLTRLDDDLTDSMAEDWMLSLYYRDTNRPGGYFCHRVAATMAPGSDNEAICIVHHRYDI